VSQVNETVSQVDETVSQVDETYQRVIYREGVKLLVCKNPYNTYMIIQDYPRLSKIIQDT